MVMGILCITHPWVGMVMGMLHSRLSESLMNLTRRWPFREAPCVRMGIPEKREIKLIPVK